MRSGTWPHVNNVIACRHHIGVMLHNQNSVAHIAQLFQCINQTQIISLVQPHGGLIQHIQNAHQPGPDLCRQPDALAFTSR